MASIPIVVHFEGGKDAGSEHHEVHAKEKPCLHLLAEDLFLLSVVDGFDAIHDAELATQTHPHAVESATSVAFAAIYAFITARAERSE